jgi:hypothetical protein
VRRLEELPRNAVEEDEQAGLLSFATGNWQLTTGNFPKTDNRLLATTYADHRSGQRYEKV